MKPANFEYVCPASLDEALKLLGSDAGDVRVIAGGQSLVAMMNLRLARPDVLVDINHLGELHFHKRDGDTLRIGALARHAELAASSLVQEMAPLMSAAYKHVAHHTVRNRGTLVGNLCHADPASEMPAVVLALNGDMVLRSMSGERVVAARDFFLGPYSTAIAAGEMLIEVRIPQKKQGYGFEEVSIRQGDFALTLVASTLSIQNGKIAKAAVAYAGVGAHAIRLDAVEQILVGQAPSDALFAKAAEAAAAQIDPGSDAHADAEYRRDLIRTLTPRALQNAATTA